ncbi:formimidoylglutamase [Chromobacterium sp. LK1]|uniref:formimidoylglutamase n=1 Tax=Chromobacterium sp. LK1 TaxID=1628193 RepID=UPI000653A9C0|nr:formimidoylglutamase [Chromobacterium sp. LK1]KMN30652.1 formimidoylglutamase [Chromobacterium sp. LK1]
MTLHTPPAAWSGRIDAEGELARRWHQRIRPWQPGVAAGVALLGFACDAGVRRNQGRPGAAAAPRAIRRALANLAWHQPQAAYDAGDVHCRDDELEAAQAELGRQVAGLLDDGQFPIVLGGGHEVAYGSFLGLARHLETAGRAPRVGIINIDAHLDLRQSPLASSGTPFAQIAADCKRRGWPFHYLCAGVAETANTAALFATARQLDVQMLFDEELQPWRLEQPLQRLRDFIEPCDCLYLTMDLDALPASQAPGVSAPAALGVPLATLEALIDILRASGKLRLADIAELNPELDQDQLTARTAARLIHRLTRPL